MATTPVRFTGFPAEAVDFYAGLEADNSRAYWQDHKGTWERTVRDPMRALLEELADEFGEGKLFRPHRDIRFSADKSPYKTHQGALVGTEKETGYYVQVSAAGLLVGGGFHAHSSAQTARYRAAVDHPDAGPALERIVERLTGEGYAVNGDRVKTTPRGWPADHPRIELIRMKEVMVTRDLGEPAWLDTPRTLDEVRDAWRGVRPLVTWVAEHVGPD